ncbi:MAG: orotidine-5'-phosphate decarboxylase [Bacteroidetes bacterium]|nr:orotidine-5'-phosphate decarboxylase [Bacteroidota bacterium]MCL5026911.1 orotidine-5'-phosphate decarboxylase [Chloroflexota bacterium]
MSLFEEKLLDVSRRRSSLVCVGLDIDPHRVPPHLGTGPKALLAFNRSIIEATADLVCAYKPNLAFYEALGLEGWALLRATLAVIPQDTPVIADAKRGDVGNTATAYAHAVFEDLGFDAVTVSPYLGEDALLPFLEWKDKGIFVLCKTSNPGSAEFQDLLVAAPGAEPRPLYEVVASRVLHWNRHGNCGLVVGATYPTQLQRIRQMAPELPILIPGVGAQAGDLEATVRYGVDEHGQRAIINSARGIIYASTGRDFAYAARQAAKELREAINRVRFAREEATQAGEPEDEP